MSRVMNVFRLWGRINRVNFSAAILLFSALCGQAAFSGDEHWDPQFGWPGRAAGYHERDRGHDELRFLDAHRDQ